jgi:hypothetical protein
MATTFVPISTSTRLGASLRRAVDTLESAKQQLENLKAVMETQISGSDYTLVESQFGLQAGQGQTAYNLVAGVVSDLHGANTTGLTGQCG